MIFHPRFIDYVEVLDDSSYMKTELLQYAETNVKMKKELAQMDEDHMMTIRNLGKEVRFDGHEDQKTPTPLFDPQDVINEYPMLSVISFNIMSNSDKVFEYIALVDAQ